MAMRRRLRHLVLLPWWMLRAIRFDVAQWWKLYRLVCVFDRRDRRRW